MIFAELNNKRILANPLEKNAICPLCKSSMIAKCGEIKIWHWAHKNNCECDSFGEPETEWHLNWKNYFPKECQEIIIKKCISDYCYNSYKTTGQNGHAPCDHINCVDCKFKKHIADVKIKDIIIEFQNSPISLEEIREREYFYEKMKWVLNGKLFAQNLYLKDKNKYKSFRWKWAHKSWSNANCPIYIDMQPLVEELILELEKLEKRKKENSKLFEYYIEKLNYGEKFLQKQILEYSNKLFLIKKIYWNGYVGGWGKLISKENFLQEANDGYYRN